MKNNFFKAILYFAVALLFVLSSVWLSALISKKVNPPQPPPTPIPIVTRNLVECPPNYTGYESITQNTSKVTKLIGSKKNMFAQNGRFVNSQIVITKNETAESKVACGYLFVRAGTTTHGPLQSWEYLYINPNDFGGHLDKENQFGPGDGRNYSEYLFALNKIKYWKDNRNFSKEALLTADWAALLNVSDKVSFQIAFNTNDYSGFIDELSLAYKCWNPTTGEENNQCNLNILSSDDTLTANPF